MTERLPFIDWMKALGMAIIIYGHTAGTGILEFTQPFNPKQLGVAFFVFVMGFSLARETRPAGQTVYNRFFEMALFGWIGALVVSVYTMVLTGDFAESNYLPLLFGVNVLFDYFPANPTTWYIGTYWHLLLLWLLLTRRWTVPTWVLPVLFVFEIATRAFLIEYVGNYVAYMLFTNWIGVFVFGMWAGQRQLAARPSNRSLIAASVALVIASIGWPLVAKSWQIDDSFPFRRLDDSLLYTSIAVSALYFGYTSALFAVTRRLPELAVVKLLARNTVVVFISHMPLVYALTPFYYAWVPAGWPRVLVNMFLFFFVLSWLSDFVRKLVRPRELRDFVWARLARVVPAARAIPSSPEKARR